MLCQKNLTAIAGMHKSCHACTGDYRSKSDFPVLREAVNLLSQQIKTPDVSLLQAMSACFKFNVEPCLISWGMPHTICADCADITKQP